MSRGNWMLLVVFSVLIGWLVYWFTQNFERVEIETFSSFKGEARSNKLLAARRFSKAMGLPAHSLQHLPRRDELPEVHDTLVLMSTRANLSAQYTEALLEWLNRGGHLVLQARRDFGTDFEQPLDDRLLERLGIRVFRNDSSKIDDADAIYIVVSPLFDQPLHVEVKPYLRLETTRTSAQVLMQNQQGVTGLRQTHGDGLITVLTDMSFITNRRIGQHDNALFFWHLLQTDHTPQNLWLVYSEEMPPLWHWLWKYVWPIITTLFVLLTAALIAAIQRFGPIIDVESTHRRRILEHIEASGHFQWQHGKKQQLFHYLRTALDDRLSTIHPIYKHHTLEERVKLLSRLSGISAQAIHKLLSSPRLDTPKEFTEAVQQLNTIRKRI